MPFQLLPLTQVMVSADGRSIMGAGGTRGAADHRQLPDNDLEMSNGVAAATNGHAVSGRKVQRDTDDLEADPAVYSLEDEDGDLIVGPEILGPEPALPGA